MCGLVGFVGAGDAEQLSAMTDALTHRGPDEAGYLVDTQQRVFLGHRRLSIVDLAGGQQPVWNEDWPGHPRVCVVFNGEIYNHAQLRQELEACGHVFRTQSDTEVLVHGYEQWGEDLPIRLNGMFAFVIYDVGRQQLFMARDRFGEKPLYYTHQNHTFAFASEIGAFRPHPGLVCQPDDFCVQKYFLYGYVPAPNTLFRQIYKLPGGCCLTLDIATREARARPYWQFSITPDEALTDRDEPRLLEELRFLLKQAVARRLMSDVPIGFFLSGGIDSSTVVAMAAQCMPAHLMKTFTIGFSEASYDESGYARQVADFLGTQHHQETLDLNRAQHLIPQVLQRLGEPLGDASILPTYLLCDFTRKHVTVALSGDGADELFAGYDPFKALTPGRWYQRLVRPPAHQVVRHLAERMKVSETNMSLDFKIRRTLMGLSYPATLWNPVWLSPIEPDCLGNLFKNPIATAAMAYEEVLSLWEQCPSKHLADKSLEFYTRFYLQEGILTKVDRAAMQVSLETRAVFLDNDLVAFCQRLPYRFKFRGGAGKYLLKKAIAGMLPDAITRRGKKGFGIPLVQWLKQLPPPPVHYRSPTLQTDWVQQCWQQHLSGQADHRLFLWSWLSLNYALPAPMASIHTEAAASPGVASFPVVTV
jgi:asparagine synthase (glutamine-hydrolysing)